MQEIMEKRCSHCGETKPVAAFSRGTGGIGYASWCQRCLRDYRREKYGKFPDPNPRTIPGGPRPQEWRCPRCRIVKPVTEYYPKDCPKGFETPCKDCHREHTRSAHVKATHARYHTSEKGRQVARRRLADPVRAERYRLYQQVYQAGRVARRRGLPATLTAEEWQQALAWFEHRCAYCGAADKLTQDHVIPVAQGGGYTAGNIVPACAPCNQSKYARSAHAWCTPEAYRRVMAYIATVVESD